MNMECSHGTGGGLQPSPRQQQGDEIMSMDEAKFSLTELPRRYRLAMCPTTAMLFRSMPPRKMSRLRSSLLKFGVHNAKFDKDCGALTFEIDPPLMFQGDLYCALKEDLSQFVVQERLDGRLVAILGKDGQV